MKTKHHLIFGSTGLIGSELLRLLASGHVARDASAADPHNHSDSVSSGSIPMSGDSYTIGNPAATDTPGVTADTITIVNRRKHPELEHIGGNGHIREILLDLLSATSATSQHRNIGNIRNIRNIRNLRHPCHTVGAVHARNPCVHRAGNHAQ
jgi:hypothetical protein